MPLGSGGLRISPMQQCVLLRQSVNSQNSLMRSKAQAAFALKQPLCTRQVAGLRPALDVGPPEQATEMDFDGVLADLQVVGNVVDAQAFVQQDQQLFLPFR